MFTRKLNSSRDEIIPVFGEMSLTPTVYTFLLRWIFIHGWTHSYQKDRDEILPWDEEKKKKRVNASSWDEILKFLIFVIFASWVPTQENYILLWTVKIFLIAGPNFHTRRSRFLWYQGDFQSQTAALKKEK